MSAAASPRSVDVRFLSATNSDLENDPRAFRPDLLDRLRMGGTLWLPPLRERIADIPLLVERFVREARQQRPGTLRRDITAEAMDRVMAHDWPGNVRELRACLFDAVNRYPDVEHLVPAHLRIGAPTPNRTAVVDMPPAGTAPGGASDEMDFPALLTAQAAVQFDPQEVSRWSARLGDLQLSQTRLLARYLQAGLEVTKRRTLEHPEGLIQIHPAVKLITGDNALTASKAADLVKRLLGPIENELEGDLREALSTALRLRPRSTKVVDGDS